LKKFFIFAISFALLFIIFQVISGMLLTMLYTPNIEEAWSMSGSLSQETVITGNSNSFLITLFTTLLSAAIAYLIPKKLIKNN
jgi:quinol-cytochrome oxidoreductase complex cytochrome b subunit